MINGGCRCGATRYTLALDVPPPVYCCHCRDCQSWSGSAFSEQALLRGEALAVTGPLVEYRFTTPSGFESHHRLCGVCHARIYNTNTMRPELAVLRAGTLDASDTLSPRLHMWVKRKQPWVTIADDVPAFAENPPPAEFIAIMLRPAP